jgi:hypothetical protein
MSNIRLELAREQIAFARRYTTELIESVPTEHWFQISDSFPTHIAWQVGHLAMAQYGLTIMRIRGREPEDEALIPKDFIRKFKKGSTPTASAEDYPTPAVIRATFDAVHEASLAAMAGYQEADLEESLPAPTAVYENKLGSLFMCSAHEMVHAGQIGLLRRMIGLEPVR